ncbi:MAG: DoxX family protein [Turneriella sp.]|nr:DoxX family protein [Turneriella sp.]
MKINKIVYWSATLLLSAMMLLSAGMYLGKFSEMSAGFQALGYPAYLPAVLATAKILGVAAILFRRVAVLREWAYAGFFFNFTLALIAHIATRTSFAGVIVAFVLLLTSYLFERKTRVA